MPQDEQTAFNILVYSTHNESDLIRDALQTPQIPHKTTHHLVITHDFAEFSQQLHQTTWHLCLIFCQDNTTLTAFRAQITAGLTVPALIVFDPQTIHPETIITLNRADYLMQPTTSALLRHRVNAMLTTHTHTTSDPQAMLAHEIESSFKDYYHRTESIINAMSEIVLVLDADGRYVDVITRHHPMLFLPASELMGKKIDEILPDTLAQDMLSVVRRTLISQQSQTYEYAITFHEKGVRWFRANVNPLNEQQVLWVASDITDFKYARLALSDTSQRYETLFRFANDAIFMIDGETGNILEANRQASQLLGYTTAELRQMTIADIEASSGDLSTNSELDIHVQSPAQMILEQFYRHKSGEIIPVETSNRIIHPDDNNIVTICFARDIRERKNALRAERQQRILAEALRDTATAISRALDKDALLDVVLDHAYKLAHKRPINIMLIEGQLAYIVRHRGYTPFVSASKLDDMRFDLDRAISIKRMLLSKRPNVINDTRQEPEWLQIKGMEWIQSQMSIPVILQNQVIAIINADSPDAHTFSPQDRALAEQISVAFQNSQLFEQIQKQTHELERTVATRTRALSDANIALKKQIIERARIEEQLEQVLNSARCLLWSATVTIEDDNYNWRFLVANEDAAQKLLPLDTEDRTYSQAWEESILFEDRHRRTHVLNHHLRHNQTTYKQELRCFNRHGDMVWLIEDVLIKPVSPNEWYLAGVCTDITDLKAAEAALQQANTELERRVQQRTEELTRANAALIEEVTERKKAETAEREQRILAEALRDSGAMLIDNFDHERLLDYLLDTLARVIPHDASNIGLIHDQIMTVTRQRGYQPPLNLPSIDVSQWVDIQSILQNRTYYIIHDRKTFKNWAGIQGDTWVQSNLSIPIILDDEVIGVLKLESRHPNQFTDKQAQWLQAFANQAGVALRNARLMEKIRHHSVELQQRVEERTAQLASEHAQLQAILDSMRDGVYYQDSENTLQYTNTALTHITGYPTHAWRNRTVFNHINTSSPDEYERQMRLVHYHLDTLGFWHGETALRHHDGHMIDVSITRAAVHDADRKRLGVVTVVRDISQEKELAAQKARFIASASHELRTPIANLKTRLFLMARAPDKFEEHIAVAKEVVNWMQRLVEDMFDLARFERGVIELDFESVHLQKFINDIVTFQQPEAERKRISLLTEMPTQPLYFKLDPYRMTQVITNLVTNALHYTPTEGQIKIDVDLNDDASITLRVTDTGKGIDAEHLPYLFQPFYRGNINSKGAGLGLSISKEIVESHGGTIHVTSQSEQGSQFIIHLPAHNPQDEPTP